ncbi:hypothetical protein ID866_6829 [Astraeus odoratus]|nr:hypothetical protein ID866_6829 [Astraeus odoratus]
MYEDGTDDEIVLQGHRIEITNPRKDKFPGRDLTKEPVCYDVDGVSPVFLGSAPYDEGIHPCKIVPELGPGEPICHISYGGDEIGIDEGYNLLPFDPEAMEWVTTSRGQIPFGRYPVLGGYENSGELLYHAMAQVEDWKVPGKTGEHLLISVAMGWLIDSSNTHNNFCIPKRVDAMSHGAARKGDSGRRHSMKYYVGSDTGD